MEARLAEKDSMIGVLKKQQQHHLQSSVDSAVRSQPYDRATGFHPISLTRFVIRSFLNTEYTLALQCAKRSDALPP